MKKYTCLSALLCIFLMAACGKKDLIVREDQEDVLNGFLTVAKYLNIGQFPVSYHQKLPKYLKSVGMMDPVISDAKATLGRVLFYDKSLSRDGKISCASCHKQQLAFADAQKLSNGIEAQITSRNSPALANVVNFSSHYSTINGLTPLLFWDDRAATVAEQARQTFANEHEMGMQMAEVVQKVKAQPYYPYLWNQAYGAFDVDEDQVLECLQEFVGAISCQNSLFDDAMEASSGQVGEADTIVHQVYYGTGHDTTITIPLVGFNASQFRGLKLFVSNCSKCHSPIRPFQEVFEACNGLEVEYTDKGLGARTGRPGDNGVFKSPPLRNIALTAPYMHDGRFKTLREVVEFYSTGVKESPNLHPALRKNGSIHMNFTAQEKEDLVAFMGTLTDPFIQSDDRFSNPFKQ